MYQYKIFAETIDAKKSVGLMKKLGMQLEDIEHSKIKDDDEYLHCYHLLKDDWSK